MPETSSHDTGSFEPGCAFCSITDSAVLLKNDRAFVVKDIHPIARWHVLVIPRRHVADYFGLEREEVVDCQALLVEARALILREDPGVQGFNIGINSGRAAGQSVMHCHIHLIPRGSGDGRSLRSIMRGIIAP